MDRLPAGIMDAVRAREAWQNRPVWLERDMANAERLRLFKDAGLHPKTAGTLQRSGFKSLDEVRAKSDVELLAVRNLGRTMLAEIRAVLGEHAPPNPLADLQAATWAYLDAVDHYATTTMVVGSGQRERAFERMEMARRKVAELIGWKSSVVD